MNGMTVYAATACFPGRTPDDAMEALSSGIDEPVMGRLSVGQVQLCPQNHGVIDDERLARLQQHYPHTRFRLHANVRTVLGQPRWTAADVGQGSLPYFDEIGRLSHLLRADAYSLHAGRRASATLEQLRGKLLLLEDRMGLPVGVEGLYPHRRTPQLVDSWKEYQWLMDSGVRYAVDLSHLNIVAYREKRRDEGLVEELLANPKCLEVHVSDNDGRRDVHRVPKATPWWYAILAKSMRANPKLVVFSEGNQLRA